MSEDVPRPGAALLLRATRAGSECLGGSSDLANNNDDAQHQDKSAEACSIRLGQVRVRCHGADRFCVAIGEALLLALTMAGPRTLECPKTSAAFHESGHCVVGAVQGSIPSKATIWPVVELGRSQCVGRTYGLPSWRVDVTTDPQADLRHARSQLAGVVSEALFDHDYRQGSPLDGIVTAQGIVLSAATKLFRNPEQLWLETFFEVAWQLKTNELVVRQLFDALIRRGSIKAQQLQQLLQALGKIDA
jgi:hypothetical protein